jgi:hypothetical protein
MGAELRRWFRAGLIVIMLPGASAAFAVVEFPGPLPGNAECSQKDGVFTLENAVIAASWHFTHGQLRPEKFVTRLIGKEFNQPGAELFRLGLAPAREHKGVAVAAAAKWAQTNADVLVDSHCVGGDPLMLNIYGYASWNPRKGALMLRNPGDQPQTGMLDAVTGFELPAGAAKD